MTRHVKYDYSKLWIQIFCLISIIYYILNIIFPTDYSLNAVNENRLYPQLSAALLAFISICISLARSKTVWSVRIFRPYILLYLLACIYIVYPMHIVDNIKYVSRTYMAIITMTALFSLYASSKKEKRCDNAVSLIFFFQVLFCFSSLISDHIAFSSSFSSEFDSNSGFMLISCVPMALLLPNKRIGLYAYIVLVCACIVSGQRSAALAAAASAPFCLWYLKDCITKRDIFIFGILGAVVIIPLLVDAISNIQLRNEADMEKGEAIGSGRLIFWGIIVNDFFQKDFFHIMFGNGTNSVAELLDKSYGIAIGAHNGWLDIMYTFGFCGVVLYAIPFFVLLKENKANRQIIPQYRTIYLILALIFFVKASTSHGYFDTSVIPFMMVIGIVEGKKYHIRKSKS